jgi:hypothetical protein
MTGDVLISGTVLFVAGLSEHRVRRIAAELGSQIDIEPELLADFYTEWEEVQDRRCVILYRSGDFPKPRYELYYNYAACLRCSYDDVLKGVKKVLITHAKEIGQVNLLFYSLSTPDDNIVWDHTALVNELVKRVERNLAGEEDMRA